MTARSLAAALLTIALLTLVVPPLAARQVHERRIARAQRDVQRLAGDLLGARSAELAAALPASAGSTPVLTGPGAAPRLAPGLAWPDAPTFPAARLFGGIPDPWGNHYLILLTGSPDRVVVLSAGPNGIIETSIAAGDAPAGDDIATAGNVRLKPDATTK